MGSNRSEQRADARRRVAIILGNQARAAQAIHQGVVLEIELTTADGLDDLQIGFSVTQAGESLLGSLEGWKSNWLVIGIETMLGDPVFADLDHPRLPVYTALHGMGVWHPELLAESLEELVLDR